MKPLLLTAVLLLATTLQAQTHKVPVPFVGCPSNGQVGPLPPPHGKPQMVALPVAVAAQLAYYKAENSSGVLAPRGWHCLLTYGSSGANLFVSPEVATAKKIFSGDPAWKGFSGPAIQISVMDGGTSGRFAVAQMIARLFPAHRVFLDRVKAEGIMSATDFPEGPYPADRLTRKSDDLVEFETPPHSEGLGTHTYLTANASSIHGFEYVSTPPDADGFLISLALRLPPSMAGLTAVIIQQTEAEARSTK